MLLDDLSSQNLSIVPFFLGKLSSFSKHINKVAIEVLDLLQVSFDVWGNSLEIPQFLACNRLDLVVTGLSAPILQLAMFENVPVNLLVCLWDEPVYGFDGINLRVVLLEGTLFVSFFEYFASEQFFNFGFRWVIFKLEIVFDAAGGRYR